MGRSVREHLSAPAGIVIYITDRCNFKCKYCFLEKDKTKLQRELNLKEIKNTFDQLQKQNVLVLSILGGEPLLHSDFLEIIDLLKSYPFCTLLSTNGYLITDEIVRHLKEANIALVQVSLDGPKKIHEMMCGVPNSFEKVIAGIQRLKKNNIRVALNFVLTNLNIDYFFETLNIAADLNVDRFKILPFSLTGKAKNEAGEYALSYNKWKEFYLDLTIKKIKKELVFDKISLIFFNCNDCPWEMYYPLPKEKRKELLKAAWEIDLDSLPKPQGRIYCQAALSWCAIDPNGNIFPCDLMREIKEFKIGNIRKHSLKDLWHKSKVFKMLRNIDRRDLIGPCRECDTPLCSGNCLATAYCASDGTFRSDMNCVRAKRHCN